MSASKKKWIEAHLAMANAQTLAPHFADPSKAEGFLKKRLSDARKTALLLGAILIVTLVTAVYGFVQKIKAQEAERRAQVLVQQATQAPKALESQRADAQISLMAAQEALHQAKSELEKCKSKK